jgi:hypothetical protein
MARHCFVVSTLHDGDKRALSSSVAYGSVHQERLELLGLRRDSYEHQITTMRLDHL